MELPRSWRHESPGRTYNEFRYVRRRCPLLVASRINTALHRATTGHCKATSSHSANAHAFKFTRGLRFIWLLWRIFSCRSYSSPWRIALFAYVAGGPREDESVHAWKQRLQNVYGNETGSPPVESMSLLSCSSVTLKDTPPSGEKDPQILKMLDATLRVLMWSYD